MTSEENEASFQIEDLKKENEELREEVSYLNKKCGELISDKNDDALISLLKKKINDLENLLSETESDYEDQLNKLRKRFNEMQKENILLQTKLRDSINNSGVESPRSQSSMKYKKYEEMLQKKNDEIKQMTKERLKMQGEIQNLKQALALQKKSNEIEKENNEKKAKSLSGDNINSYRSYIRSKRKKVSSRPGSSSKSVKSRSESFRLKKMKSSNFGKKIFNKEKSKNFENEDERNSESNEDYDDNNQFQKRHNNNSESQEHSYSNVNIFF